MHNLHFSGCLISAIRIDLTAIFYCGSIIYKASAVVNSIFEEKFALLSYAPKTSQKNFDTKNRAKKHNKIAMRGERKKLLLPFVNYGPIRKRFSANAHNTRLEF